MSEEKKRTRGHFRLFFGMAAGVGKTYQMLAAAHERFHDGADVCAGIVETHGRGETQKMLADLSVIPRKKIQYRGTTLEEMDLDAILTRKPKLVLVDELAHTNAPGSRHEKRYQDVIEILDAGIDVYSTMNVQHLESRADIIGLITATNVRETVPDSVLDLVDQVELIDITPGELINRLKEGKIYPGRKTEQALQYFFQEANLSALREIILRVTADKVERDMRGVRPSQTSSFSANASGKLLVAVGHGPFSEKLIRTARRMVEDLEIPWVAVHVDTEKVLSPKDQNQLVKNLDLAQEMGAQTVTLHGVDVVETISAYAESQKVTQIIVGRPRHSDKRWARPQRFVETLIKKNPNIDITILQHPGGELLKQYGRARLKWELAPLSLLQAVLSVLAVALINRILVPYVGYKAVGFLFLFLVVVLSTFLPFTAVFVSAILSGGIWDYFFIPPIGTMSVRDVDDAMMLLAYFVISCVSGFLTFQVKRNQRILKDREEKTQALYEILKSMTLVRGTRPLIDMALVKMEKLFNAECCVLLADGDRLSLQPDFGKLELNENDHAVAAWSFSHGRKAGWSTDTLPLSRVYCLSLKSGETKFGVLILHPKVDKKFNPEQENLLISIANQIGIVLAKENYDEESRRAKLVKESEKLHQTLLNCVSHELRTPLTAIMGAATAIGTQVKSDAAGSPLKLYAEEIISASARLNHVFENLLDVTRLESGSVKLNREWFDFGELIRFAVDRQKRLLSGHKIQLNLSSEPIYYFGDYDLLAHAFSNILLNAANYAPPHAPVAVALKKVGNRVAIEISDKGPGIPKESFPRLFEKFYRLPGTPAGGLGLGLSITKNLVELHDGNVQVRNNPDAGATFSLVFPWLTPPKQIEEASK